MRNSPLHKLFIFPFILLLAGLACNASGPQSTPLPTRHPGWIQTAAVATQTAEAPAAPVVAPTAAPDRPTPTLESVPPVIETSVPAVLTVAYVKDGGIWLWVAGRPPQRITSGDQRIVDVNLSPDGQMLAYIRAVDDYRSELWVVNADGTGEQVVFDAAALSALDPGAFGVGVYQYDWVPGTHTLAFNTRHIFEGPGLVLYNDLRVVDPVTGEVQVILSPGQGGTFYYSPNGSRVAVVTHTHIHLANADGSGLAEVFAYPPVITYSEYQYHAEPSWSTDGLTLRVAMPPADPLEEPVQPTTLWVITTDGTAPPTQVGEIYPMPFLSMSTAFSPDNARLAYVKSLGDPSLNLRELHLANANGSDDSVFTVQPFLTFLSWSADGAAIAFTSGEQGDSHIARLDGDFVTLPKESSQRILNLEWIDALRVIYAVGSYGPGGWSLNIADIGEPSIIGIDSDLPCCGIFDWTR